MIGTLTIQSLLFLIKSKEAPRKRRVYLAAEPLKSLQRRQNCAKKKSIGAAKKQGNPKKQGLEGAVQKSGCSIVECSRGCCSCYFLRGRPFEIFNLDVPFPSSPKRASTTEIDRTSHRSPSQGCIESHRCPPSHDMGYSGHGRPRILIMPANGTKILAVFRFGSSLK